MAVFPWTQCWLRWRYRIRDGTRIRSYGPEVERDIRRAAARRRTPIWAETSGSTATPKRILYTRWRVLLTKWTFIEAFVRVYRAYGGGLASTLYVFRPFRHDRSLTSALVKERGVPSRISLAQAPYRAESDPAIQALERRYGATAVRLWILALSNPGVLYGTNPSTLWLFFHEVATEWDRSRQFIVDLSRRPDLFDPAVHRVAARLAAPGGANRISQIAGSPVPLPPSIFAPAAHMAICWTGGHVRPFVDRLRRYLPDDRYRIVPMYSMSTETVETIVHPSREEPRFLPLAPGVLYEFLHVDASDAPENLKMPADLVVGQSYVMVVSDAFGLRRYRTEDVFLCMGLVRGLPDLRFVGRRRLEYSFTGEKLSSAHLEAVFTRLRNETPLISAEAILACVPSQPPGSALPHYKIAVMDAGPAEAGTDDLLAQQCDEMIQQENVEYRYKRRSRRLGGIQIVRMSPSDVVARLTGSPAALDGQFKFLPLYGRLWEQLPGAGEIS
ncbi:MAG TPA: GH3 auxin-responsive promoter family protein [Terriglobia bacterium]|nr:GH3 auxin-responsive promoter family protein [Terriglobia bacterium]